jgi:hypothetical protein
MHSTSANFSAVTFGIILFIGQIVIPSFFCYLHYIYDSSFGGGGWEQSLFCHLCYEGGSVETRPERASR